MIAIELPIMPLVKIDSVRESAWATALPLLDIRILREKPTRCRNQNY